ncbi:MAG TPA: VOC family protein [Thermoanaerobaculia bacterium]|nr:VOC family protein [Thermoanaerobaculia bacterium]
MRGLRPVLIIAGVVLGAALADSAAAQSPVLELDHAYIIVPPGAAAALQALRQAGIVIDSETVRHDGEGTTSMAAFFENGYLELMWVDSTVTVDSAHERDVAEFRRAAAWDRTGASPFGIGLHFLSGSQSDLKIPFRSEPVPEGGPAGSYILLRQPAESLAPDVFIMPPEGAVTAWIDRFRSRQPERFAHPSGFHRITRVVLRGPPAQRPRAADLGLRLVRFEAGDTPLLEVEFDGGRTGRRWDLRPALPVVLSR